ncbi:MAG TPA: hypothetical protein VIU38_03530 [Anaerolineales bacterium]
MEMNRVLDVTALLTWATLWAAGGCLLAGGTFRLRRTELAMVGIGVGLIIQVWLANLLSRLVPVPVSFWASAVLVLVLGIIAALRARGSTKLIIDAKSWLILGALTLLFYGIGTGLAIFDDYQNLPTVSLMAAGDIPPHFALNPDLQFGYHYLLLLFASELMRLGNLLPWSALDLARALMLALPLVLVGLWSYRISRRWVWALLGSSLFAFAGGARWLLLLLPPALLTRFSEQITLIGSAASSAPTLADAMVSSWKIDGAGPIAFPFAFYSGVNQPYVMAYTGIAGSGILILLMLLLTAERWKNKGAAVLSAVLLSALALANEIAFLLMGLGFLLVTVWWISYRRKRGGGRTLVTWLVVLAVASAIAAIQGGMLTEIVRSRITHDTAAASYFDPSPGLAWPPAIVSAHLGSLSVANLSQLFAALLEIGPVVLVFPLVAAWGLKSLRMGRWFEAALIAGSAGALLGLFLTFKGPLLTAAPRLMSGWFLVCALYFVPLTRLWAAHRPESLRAVGAIAGFLSCVGGFVLLGVQLTAIQRPVTTTFISPIDAAVTEHHWNELEAGAIVFDPVVFRAPTVFGRPTKSSPTWYSRLPAWEQLVVDPEPYSLRKAGFAYAYLDRDYWETLDPALQGALSGTCVKELWQVDGVHSDTDYTKDFRRLLDMRSCK